jgi:tetratricopeptide (TPR) repeat protein
VKLVLSDLAPANLAFWRSHPKFAPYFKSGQLDCAVLDASRDDSVRLEVSGQVLGAPDGNPLIVFANYVLDSIPADFFWINEGVPYESLVNLFSTEPDDDPADPEILSRIRLHYERRPIETPHYYDDPTLNLALWRCAGLLSNSAFSFPALVIRWMERLRQMSGGNMLLLASDKGLHRVSDLEGKDEPNMSVHGAFSLDVNYLALAQYTEIMGGRMLATEHGHSAIDTVAFVLGKPEGHPETAVAYEQAVNRVGPDEFFRLKRAFDDPEKIPDAAVFLVLLRLSGFDLRILVGGMPKLFGMLPECSDALKHDFAVACRTAWDTYFSIGEPADFDYPIGAILAQLGADQDAMECFRASTLLYPNNAITWFNIGVCAYHLGDVQTASGAAARALELDPTLEDAKRLQDVLETASTGG